MDKKADIIGLITQDFSRRFRVIDNTGSDKKIVAGQFPDVILMRPEPPPNSDILYLMKIESERSNLLDSVSEWRELGSTPSVLYIVVPEHRLDEAKKLASATGVRARFAAYEIKDGKVVAIRYE